MSDPHLNQSVSALQAQIDSLTAGVPLSSEQIDSLTGATSGVAAAAAAIETEIANMKNTSPTVDFTALDQVVHAPSDTDR